MLQSHGIPFMAVELATKDLIKPLHQCNLIIFKWYLLDHSLNSVLTEAACAQTEGVLGTHPLPSVPHFLPEQFPDLSETSTVSNY